jgi:predicted MFS family arabinose efflux permease
MIAKTLLFGLGAFIGFIIISLIRKKTRKTTIEFLGALYLLLMLVLMSPSMLVGFLVHLCKIGYKTGHQLYDDIIDGVLKDVPEEENNQVQN